MDLTLREPGCAHLAVSLTACRRVYAGPRFAGASSSSDSTRALIVTQHRIGLTTRLFRKVTARIWRKTVLRDDPPALQHRSPPLGMPPHLNHAAHRIRHGARMVNHIRVCESQHRETHTLSDAIPPAVLGK